MIRIRYYYLSTSKLPKDTYNLKYPYDIITKKALKGPLLIFITQPFSCNLAN